MPGDRSNLTPGFLISKEVAMRKYLVLALIPMFFAAMACRKTEEPAPEESSAPAASAEASPAAGQMAPGGGGAMQASPEASPAAAQ
jgi:hypothetical protein